MFTVETEHATEYYIVVVVVVYLALYGAGIAVSIANRYGVNGAAI